MAHTKSLKREHRLHNIVVPEFRYIHVAHNIVVPEFRYIHAAWVVSRGRDFNTLPNRTFVPFVSVAQNVCCLSLLREMVRLSQLDRGRAIALILQGRSQEKLSEHMAIVCVQGQSEIACESSIYVHAILTWALTLLPDDVNAACNGCVPMHQIGFNWLTGGV